MVFDVKAKTYSVIEMSKKDKKIEIQVSDAQVIVNNQKVDGYQLQAGKKIIGEIAELDNRFAIVEKETVTEFHKTLDSAVQVIIANYNLNN
ncbi:branched-chain amino acid aminotransferase [Streptococcus agalactiae LMG 14747]|uniref:Branched-chain amino acid aminotransferase n=2 Tax=Streptococcus TaxID=1301 RepID=V6Z379_STRAG|nr:branched-chain amino acid aminotransferase [Streptococcus agalactiae LMG 14747]